MHHLRTRVVSTAPSADKHAKCRKIRIAILSEATKAYVDSLPCVTCFLQYCAVCLEFCPVTSNPWKFGHVKMKTTVALLSTSFVICVMSARFETGLSPGTVFRELDPMFAPLRSASLYQGNSNAQFKAPWHLDRIDQRSAQLDHIFTSQVGPSCDRLPAL